jgi:hypothetical protein
MYEIIILYLFTIFTISFFIKLKNDILNLRTRVDILEKHEQDLIYISKFMEENIKRNVLKDINIRSYRKSQKDRRHRSRSPDLDIQTNPFVFKTPEKKICKKKTCKELPLPFSELCNKCMKCMEHDMELKELIRLEKSREEITDLNIIT